MPRILLIALLICLGAATRVASARSKPTVAILYFDNNSGDKSLDVLSKGFADMLITDMSSSGSVIVVEREKLQALLDETKLQRSRFFDRKTAVKIGKGLGAHYVLSGSFIEVKPLLRIDMRMIDVASGKIVLSTQVKGGSHDIFRLEQQLVGDFLEKLNYKFYSVSLPPTKVPDVDALLDYSRALALVDKGQEKQAAALMKKLVKKAPTFGLARAKSNELQRKLAESSERRDAEFAQDTKALFAEARAFVNGHALASLNAEQAEHYLGYRRLLGLEIAVALHQVLGGRHESDMAIPRKRPGPALGLMRSYYNNQRMLLKEQGKLLARLGRVSARLPVDSAKLARTLNLEVRDGNPSETLLEFMLGGRVPSVGKLPHYKIAPALADIDPKMKNAALTLAKAEWALTKPAGRPGFENHQAQILETVARWHIARGRIEEGVTEYQKILDRFPKIHRWSRLEQKIKHQLGLARNHNVRLRQSFEKGMATCDWSEFNVGLGRTLKQRISSAGLVAIFAMEKKLGKACQRATSFPKMKKTFYRRAFLAAAAYEDCELFEVYLKKWRADGGSSSEAAAYRRNYSSCK